MHQPSAPATQEILAPVQEAEGQSFTIFHTNPDVRDAAWQHGLNHPAVVVNFPFLECECTEYSHVDIEPSACREGGQVYFFVSVRGLFPQQAGLGFVYELDINWSCESDKLRHTWKSLVTAQTLTRSDTDSYTLREPLGQLGVMVLETYKNCHARSFFDVTVRDMHPGLIPEEALIGARHMDSSVNTVPLKCVEPASALLANTASRERASSKTIFLATTNATADVDSDENSDELRGLGHPAVFIDKYTTLQCECDDARGPPCGGGGACAWGRAVGGARSSGLGSTASESTATLTTWASPVLVQIRQRQRRAGSWGRCGPP